MITRRFLAMLASAIAICSAPAFPQATSPCPADPERHHFDFWLGEWNVTTIQGNQVGTSRIESIANGCALLENWTGGRGGTGKSINAYNPVIKQWQQYWVGSDGEILDYTRSEFDGKSMIFFASSFREADHRKRLTFTPQDASTVRQHAETSVDGGKTWKTEYDFYYHRKSPG